MCLKREPDNPSGYDRVVKVSQASNAKTTNQGVPQGKESNKMNMLESLHMTVTVNAWLLYDPVNVKLKETTVFTCVVCTHE